MLDVLHSRVESIVDTFSVMLKLGPMSVYKDGNQALVHESTALSTSHYPITFPLSSPSFSNFVLLVNPSASMASASSFKPLP
jgi:hypothetical protein